MDVGRGVGAIAAFARLARRLSAARSTDAVAAAVAEGGSEVIGADLVNVGLVVGGEQLELVHPVELPDDIGDRYRRVPLDHPLPFTEAIATGAPVLVADLDEFTRRYPTTADDHRAAGMAASAAFPLRRGDGTVIGALGVSWSHPVSFDDELLARIDAVVELCAQTFERSRLTDAANELAGSLQVALLPPLPRRDLLEIAARYEPAASGLGFGGDWYDVIALDDHRTAVVVGDLVGHGVAAAARMAQLRGTTNALVRIGTLPQELFGRAQALFADDLPALIGTAGLIVVDTAAGTLTAVSAGHPPPLVVDRGGTYRLLHQHRPRPLGLVDGPLDPTTVPFPAGSVVVAYTDGLVEPSARTLDEALAKLEAQVARDVRRERSATEIADRVVAHLLGAGPIRDDLALVVLRRLAP